MRTEPSLTRRIRAIAALAAPGAILTAIPAVDRTALAYPSSVIFAPTGETLAMGKVDADAHVPMTFRPSVGPAPTWIGLDIGLLPGFSYSGDLRFGGIEIGADLINGASHPDGTTFSKPLFNAKVGLLEATGYTPAVGFGVMSFAAFQPSEGANLSYLSATKALSLRGRPYGAITLGLAWAAGASSFAFHGAPPFRSSHFALLGGYVSPEWQGFTLSVDTLGGVSDASASSIAITYAPTAGAQAVLGLSFANDRRLPNDRVVDDVFVDLRLTFDVIPKNAEREHHDVVVCPP